MSARHKMWPRRSTGVDRLSEVASNVADRTVLWWAVAAVLSATGRRFGRRAALRGLMSLGFASALSNGPIKFVAGRRRPRTVSGLTARLRGVSQPTTSSFPSAHAAAAFGFATGVAQELPVVGVPVVVLAGLVSYSRVRTGIHHVSDVLAGAAVGIGAGIATRRLWPVAPHEPAESRATLPHSHVEPSPEGGGVVVVVNASAGSADSVVDELRAQLPQVEIVEVDAGEGGDLMAALEEAAERASILGVAGGDGTVNAAAEVAASHKMPLLVVPGGTLNHFAHALGVETIADAAAAVRDGRVVAVDRAEIDGHTFLNTGSIGGYTELVDAREKLESRIGKWPAMIVALVHVLRHSEPVSVELDGEATTVWMIFVGNCRYHPDGFGPSWRERLDDDIVDIRIVHGHPWSRIRLVASILTGTLGRCGAYEQRCVRQMHVRSTSGPLRLARDGETFDGAEEFDIRKADERLLVFVPAP
ncbi:MAG TPA: phosphatase PAP2 family protein [Acidimicrobiales bacterium]|nr:phosphatase PAP2 family protein [Acidimicrobiales bacterium]